MGTVVGPGYGVSCAACAEEDAVVHPLGVDELELPPEVCPDEREHQAAVLPVVFEGPFWQWRAVGSSAPDHAVESWFPRHRGIAGVGPADVAAAGRGESRPSVGPV